MKLLCILFMAFSLPCFSLPFAQQELNVVIGKENEIFTPMDFAARLSLSEAIEELVAGIADHVFDENFLESIRKIETASLDGDFVETWPNGKIKAKGSIKNGKAEGHVHGWYEDGGDAFKAYYTEGLRLGVHIAWYGQGPNNYGKILTFDEKGQLHGRQTTYFRHYKLRSYAEYKHGKLHGPLEAYNRDEGTRFARNYKNGILLKEKKSKEDIKV